MNVQDRTKGTGEPVRSANVPVTKTASSWQSEMMILNPQSNPSPPRVQPTSAPNQSATHDQASHK
jgi:hypothetical protein